MSQHLRHNVDWQFVVIERDRCPGASVGVRRRRPQHGQFVQSPQSLLTGGLTQRSWLLMAYVALPLAVVGVAATGLDGLRVHIDPVAMMIWATLVAGVAVGIRASWYLLSGYSVLAAALTVVAFSNQIATPGRLLVVALLTTQAGILFARAFRSE